MVSRQSSMWRRWQTLRTWRAMSAAIVILGLGLALSALSYLSAHAESVDKPKIERAAKATDAEGANTVVLSDSQLQMINVGAVSEYTFPLQREAVGNIDFNEDLETQGFPPYQGRISQLYAKLGDQFALQLGSRVVHPRGSNCGGCFSGSGSVLHQNLLRAKWKRDAHDGCQQ